MNEGSIGFIFAFNWWEKVTRVLKSILKQTDLSMLADLFL